MFKLTRLAVVGLTLVGLFGAGSLVSSAPSAFASGKIRLTDNDRGKALFLVAGVKPGMAVSHCIRVSYAGSHPGLVRLFARTNGGKLARSMTLVLRRGQASARARFPSCKGFKPDKKNYMHLGKGVLYKGPLNKFPKSNKKAVLDAGGHPWLGAESHVYQFALTLSATADNSLQHLVARPAFTWLVTSR